ncbi:MAG: hypothetical protein K2G87_00620 [Oscillospiraceae bacterium]|nr:hypothetical protein [Oscillospiraceae bacterium]
MKKFFAALLTIFIAAIMCGETSLTVLAKESKTVRSSEARPADKEDLIGKWYRLHYDDAVYSFDEKGYVTITYDDETETGKYTVKNGLVTMKLTSNDKYVTKLRAKGEKYYTQYMAAVAEDGFLLTCHVNKKDAFKPYKAGQSVSEYFDELDTFPFNDPIYLSKEKPVKANQKDVLGAWIEYSERGPIICIFEEKKSIAINLEEKVESVPFILKNGHWKAVGEVPNNWSIDNDICLYLCQGKLFFTDSYSTDVYEKYTPRTASKNIFEGTDAIYQNGEYIGTAKIRNGKGPFYTFEGETTASYSVKDGKITLNLDGKSKRYENYYIAEYNDSEYGKITFVYLLKGDNITAVSNSAKIREVQ